MPHNMQFVIGKPLTSVGNEGRSPVDNPTESNRLLTVKEVAEKLRLKPYTIRRWVRLGKLPAIHLSHHAVRFHADKIERWLRDQVYKAR